MDAEAEVRRKLKKIHAGGGEKRAENRGTKAQEARREKHPCQQEYKQMAMQQRG
jgi:hypothetical protein